MTEAVILYDDFAGAGAPTDGRTPVTAPAGVTWTYYPASLRGTLQLDFPDLSLGWFAEASVNTGSADGSATAFSSLFGGITEQLSAGAVAAMCLGSANGEGVYFRDTASPFVPTGTPDLVGDAPLGATVTTVLRVNVKSGGIVSIYKDGVLCGTGSNTWNPSPNYLQFWVFMNLAQTTPLTFNYVKYGVNPDVPTPPPPPVPPPFWTNYQRCFETDS